MRIRSGLASLVTVMAFTLLPGSASPRPQQGGARSAVPGAEVLVGGKKRSAPAARGRLLPAWPRGDDPTPLVTLEFLDLTVALKQDRLKVLKVLKGHFIKAQAITPRYRGRFEVKLLSHGVLRDVVRFSFPLTGSDSRGGRGLDRLGQDLNQGVSAQTTVRIPFDQTITSVRIYDTSARATLTVDLTGLRPKAKPPRTPDSLRTNSFRPRPTQR